MPRGWAGSNADTGITFKCAICLQRDRTSRDAVTQAMGTMVCQLHINWLPIPVTPPPPPDVAIYV